MSGELMFEEKVGVLNKSDDDFMMRPVRAEIQLVQNGYKLRYNEKKFVAKTLDEAISMIKSWMEESEKEAKSKDKKQDKAES
jgi:hypothetical protein